MRAEDIPLDPSLLLRLGTVKSVDLAAATCIVTSGDPETGEEIETPPLRWLERRAGDTRTWSPPSVGEQVEIICPDGELAGGYVRSGLPCDAFPPSGDSTRELIRFKDGAIIAYDPDGHALEALLPAGATVAITASGGITLTGDVTIEGDVTLNGTLTSSADVIASGKSLKDHVHSGVSAGAANTGKPV